MLDFGTLQFELFHIIVKHFDTIFNLIICEILKGLTNLGDVSCVSHFKNNLNLYMYFRKYNEGFMKFVLKIDYVVEILY